MIRVAVGILEQDGRMLVCQRKKGARYEMKWEFPGGKVEDGEDLKATLKRELSEELNITAEIGDEVFQQRWRYPDHGEFEIHFFSVRRFSGEVRNLTFENIRWIDPENLGELDLLEGSRGVIQLLTKRTRN